MVTSTHMKIRSRNTLAVIDLSLITTKPFKIGLFQVSMLLAHCLAPVRTFGTRTVRMQTNRVIGATCNDNTLSCSSRLMQRNA